MALIKKEWPRNEVEALILAYRNYECLWNLKNPEYRDKIKRKNAFLALSTMFNTDENEIYRKLHNLRNQFGGELKKYKMKRVRDEPFTTKWPYFNLLKFIQPSLESTSGGTRNTGGVHKPEVSTDGNEVCKQIIENIKTEVCGSHLDEPANEEPSEQSRSLAPTSLLERVPDDIDTFGLFVANEIRSLTSESLRKKLKRKIQKCILEVAEEDDLV